MNYIIKKETKLIPILIISLLLLVIKTSTLSDVGYSIRDIQKPSVPNLSSNDISYSYDWNMTLGNPTKITYSDLVKDANGDLYMAGYRDNFDKSPIQSWIMRDIVIQKYDNVGKLIWEKAWGNDDLVDFCHAITLDSENNIYLAGAVLNASSYDYNLTLMKFNSEGIYQWHIIWRGTYNDHGYLGSFGIALDSDKNIYVSCQAENYDIWLVKFNNSGSYQWDRTWGATGSLSFRKGIQIDSNDNIYVVGNSEGDIVLLKYNTTGNLGWSSVWDSGLVENCNKITLDASNNIYLTGWISISKFDERNLLTIKFDPHGNELWNHTWGGKDDDIGEDIIVDSFNDTYVIGKSFSYGAYGGDACLLKFNKTSGLEWNITNGLNNPDLGKFLELDMSGNVLTVSDCEYTMLWAKFNNQGVQLWNSTISNGGSYQGKQIYIDSLDNIFLGISFWNYSTFSMDTQVVKINGNREYILNFTWGSDRLDILTGLTLDLDGNIFIGGYTSIFGEDDHDVFIVKFDQNGTPIWNVTWGGEGKDYGFDIATDSEGNVYLVGRKGLNDWDPFLVKYNSLGDYQWNQTFEGESCRGIAIDNLDNIYVAGSNLIKWNKSGDLQWVADSGNYYDVNVDSDNDVYVVEFTEDSYGYDQITTKKFNINGVYQWSHTWRGPYSQSRGYELALDKEGNIYICGFSQFNPYGWTDYLLLIYNNSGVLKYEETWGTFHSDFANSIALDSWSNVYIIGDIAWHDKTCLLKFNNDLIQPKIIINSPKSNELFSESAIDFNVSIITPELSKSWYSLNGMSNYSFSGDTGTINQTAWDLCDNGTIVVKFYANDTLGNMGFAEVIVFKDILKPVIQIITPNQYQFFTTLAPEYEIYINEGNLHKAWYSLNAGNNYSFTENTGLIDQTAWDNCDNGTVTIRFFANDTVGHLSYKSLVVFKDTITPSITIEAPKSNQLFGNTAPLFNVSVYEDNLNSTWYSLNWGKNYSFSEMHGMINQDAWNNCLEGTVVIRFYVNDSAGNLAFDDVIVLKEVSPPEIMIFNPSPNSTYGISPPVFDVYIQDDDLDLMWFTLNEEPTKYFFTSNDTIDQDAWDLVRNGAVNLTFYANDSLGNINSQSINILKQAFPDIVINFPLENGLYGFNPPLINLDVYNITADSLWYSIDGGLTNYTFLNNDAINQGAWDLKGSSMIKITFYVNSTAGDLFYKEILIEKDIDAPQININAPRQDEIFENPPIYEIAVTESNLDALWYSLNNNPLTYLISETTGTIDGAAWEQLSDGVVIITFYANDSLGLVSLKEVSVIKQSYSPPSSPPSIPGYELSILIGTIFVMTIVIKFYFKYNCKHQKFKVY